MESAKRLALTMCHGPEWRKRIMAVFTAYFDESNTAGAACVAGCIASAEQWVRFEKEWLELMRHHGLCDPFHMKEFNHSRAQFQSWQGETARRNEFMRLAIGIITRRVQIGVGMVIDPAIFDEFVMENEKRREFFDSPYVTLATLCLGQVEIWANRNGISEAVDYVFDDGNVRRGKLLDSFYENKQKPELQKRYRMGECTFADDKGVIPLQASDVVAYEISKYWTDRHKRLRRSYETLNTELPYIWSVCNREWLKRCAAEEGIP